MKRVTLLEQLREFREQQVRDLGCCARWGCHRQATRLAGRKAYAYCDVHAQVVEQSEREWRVRAGVQG